MPQPLIRWIDAEQGWVHNLDETEILLLVRKRSKETNELFGEHTATYARLLPAMGFNAVLAGAQLKRIDEYRPISKSSGIDRQHRS